MFSSDQRAEYVKTVFKKNNNVTVKTYSGLTVDFCKKNNSNFLIRGLRNPSDFEFEKSIALTNRKISDIETVFFLTSVENSYISSSIVRELIRNNGDYQLFIPKGITI
jgi:pantetheine-phosphate adenylyltransferase